MSSAANDARAQGVDADAGGVRRRQLLLFSGLAAAALVALALWLGAGRGGPPPAVTGIDAELAGPDVKIRGELGGVADDAPVVVEIAVVVVEGQRLAAVAPAEQELVALGDAHGGAHGNRGVEVSGNAAVVGGELHRGHGARR